MTQQMNENPGVVETVIDMLNHINVDGETMHYIIEQVGMNDQVLRQLIMNNPESDIKDLLEEKIDLSNQELNRNKIKKFQITETTQATITYLYEVEAKTETEALNKVLDGDVQYVEKEIEEYADFDCEPEFEIEEI
jgi:hypothetical protein